MPRLGKSAPLPPVPRQKFTPEQEAKLDAAIDEAHLARMREHYERQNERKRERYERARATRRDHRLVLARRKLDLLALFGSQCADCKQSYPFECYEFHHVNPATKHKSVSALMVVSMERAIREAKKCVLLCANCHRIRHAKMRNEHLDMTVTNVEPTDG